MNYTQLKANIENFLEDDSAELTTSIDQIIAQAEEMIFQRHQICLALGKTHQQHWCKAQQIILCRLRE